MLKFFFLFIIFSFCSLHASETGEILAQEQLGEAFFEAGDSQQAQLIYKKRLEESLPAWQTAVADYNLSTINLAAGDWKKAFDHIGKISISSISFPQLLMHVLLNQSVSFLQEGMDTSNIDQSLYYLQKSVLALKQTEQIDCQIQKVENQNTCEKSPIFTSLFKYIDRQERHLRQVQREHILGNQSIYSSLNTSLLGLKKLIQLFEWNFKDGHYKKLIREGSQDLLLVWKNLLETPVDQAVKNGIEEAFNQYLEAMKEIEEKKWEGALTHLNKSKNGLEQAQSQLDPKKIAIEDLLLSYRIELNRNFLTVKGIEEIIKKEKQIFGENPSMIFLEKSLSQLHLGHYIASRLYVLAAFYKLMEMVVNLDSTQMPELALEQLIDQTNRTLELTRLSSLEDFSSQADIQLILKENLETVYQQSDRFTGIVLKAEQTRYQKIGAIEYPRCQDKPWDQVMPLFAEGYAYVKRAQKELNPIKHLETALVYWQEALDHLHTWKTSFKLHLDQAEDKNEIPSNMQELFQSLQEMYLDDSDRPAPQKEFHAW